MKKSSLIAVILCFVLAVSMLAGCGSEEPKATDVPTVTVDPTDEGEDVEPTVVVITPTPGSDTKKPTQDPNNIEYDPITPAPENVTSGLGLGDSAKGSEFKITPTKIEKHDAADKGTEMEYKAKAGYTLVAVLLKIENISGKDAKFTATSSISASVKGEEVVDFAYLTDQFTPVDEAEIKAGSTFEGYLLFEAPSNGGTLKITYNGNGLDGDNCGIFELKY